MKFLLGSVINMDDVRVIVKTVRDLGATHEDDGYYHIELLRTDYKHLLEDVKTQQLLGYMTPESRELALANDPIFRGIYGALVTIWEPKTVEDSVELLNTMIKYLEERN